MANDGARIRIGSRELGGVAAAALLLSAFASNGCSLKVQTPATVPMIEVFDLASFGDTSQDYGVALLRADTNRDGNDELVVGSPSDHPDRDGVVLLVQLRSFVVTGAIWPLSNPEEKNGSHTRFGSVLALADFNGDGWLDLVVGDPAADLPQAAGAGEVWYYPGPLDPWNAVRLHAATPVADGAFGSTFATGDFDADGFTDLAVAAPLGNGGNGGNGSSGSSNGGASGDEEGVSLGDGIPGAGAIELFYGPDLTRRVTLAAPHGSSELGVALLAVATERHGTVLLAGAPQSEGEVDGDQGSAFAWRAEHGLDSGRPRQLTPTDAADASFGCAADTGDFDGDGADELALFASEGRGGFYFFTSNDFSPLGRVDLPALLSGRRGAPVRTLRDVSGDGADELVLLSASRNDVAAMLFSPARASAQLTFGFAAAAVIVGDFDGDPEDELLFSTPTSFKPHGGFAMLRIVDFTWQVNRGPESFAVNATPTARHVERTALPVIAGVEGFASVVAAH